MELLGCNRTFKKVGCDGRSLGHGDWALEGSSGTPAPFFCSELSGFAERCAPAMMCHQKPKAMGLTYHGLKL